MHVSQKINVAAITGGKTVASSNYRIRVLTQYLSNEGVELTEYCPFVNRTPPPQKLYRPFWLLAALAERATFIGRVRGYDAIIFQKEMISTLPSFERLLLGEKILDIDDAIYLYRNGLAARHIAKSSIGVVCGNEVLANVFSKWNHNISIIPTGVDVFKMQPSDVRLENNTKIVGWIGTPGNLKYIKSISEAIIKLLSLVKDSEFRIVTSNKKYIPTKLRPYTKFIEWYPGIEFQELPNWSLGIMPLVDDEWSRGKCSFKLLQYLSAGIPVVASPVGMNNTILKSATVGKTAANEIEWLKAMVDILNDTDMNREMGYNGRSLAVSQFSLTCIANKWKKVLTRWL